MTIEFLNMKLKLFIAFYGQIYSLIKIENIIKSYIKSFANEK